MRHLKPWCETDDEQTWIGATQISAGIVHHMRSEYTEIGLFSNPPLSPEVGKECLKTFTSLLKDGKIVFAVKPDMQVKRWQKVVWNVAWNSLTALTMLATQSWLKCSEESMPLTRQVTKEDIDVVQACKVDIGYVLIDEFIEMIFALPGIGSSMQTDCKAGRQKKVEILLRTPIKKAKEFNIDVPVLETLYALLQAANYRMKHSKVTSEV